MIYEEWNARLADHFFTPSNAGRRVYLHTTNELLAALGGDQTDFVQAVKAGPAGACGSLCGKALAVYQRWTDRRTPPPFLAHLCLFALAATRDGDWASYAYYPRLWSLLGEGGNGAPSDFIRMKELWQDLQLWTHVENGGALGIFKAKAAGKWIHVGLPIAQAILTDAERRALPAVFEEADLEPGADLAPEEVAAAVAAHAGQRLRRRTLELLRTGGDSEFRSELLQVLQSEVGDWDGTVGMSLEEAGNRRAGVRLWLKHIDATGIIDARFVVRLPSDTDESSLALASPSLPGDEFACPAGPAELSEALYSINSGEEVAAEVLSWTARHEFRCRNTGMRFVLPSAKVRVFASGADSGMQGFVEVRVMPSSGEFFVAAAPSEAEAVSMWGARCCADWREKPVRAGLPAGWHLYYAGAALSDGGLSRRYPVFSRPAAPRIRFEGGIRHSAGARYFPFALPVVAVDWTEQPLEVLCNGAVLSASPAGRYVIPASLAEPICHIDVRFSDREAHELLFIVSDGWRWSDGSGCVAINRFGQPPASGELQIRGADMGSAEAPEFAADPATASDEAEQAVWIGSVPGQIADLRRGHALPSWTPVWIVTFRRKQVRFTYCGMSLGAAEPDLSRHEGIVKKWKWVVWGTRKRAAPMRNPRIEALLRRYREAAHGL